MATPTLAPIATSWPRTGKGKLQDVNDSARHQGRAVAVGRRPEQDGELVAAKPGRKVRAPDHTGEAIGDRHKEAVPGCMSLRIVDDLEVVEVQEEHDRAFAPSETLFDCLGEEDPVREARQRIVVGR